MAAVGEELVVGEATAEGNGAADSTDGPADATDGFEATGVDETGGTEGDTRGLATDGAPQATTITATASALGRGIFPGSMSRKAL